MRGDHQRGFRRHQQRVAVGLGLRDRVGADAAGRARAVLDNERLPEGRLQMRLHQPRDQVGPTAGRERNDDPDRPCLGLGDGRA